MSMSTLRIRTAVVGALVAATAVSGLMAVPAHADTVVSSYQSVTSTGSLGNGAAPGGTVTRHQVIQRAQDWVDNNVPYSPNGLNSPYGWWADSATGGRYRQDCSGLVSMAWQLSSSLTTWTLPDVSTLLGSLDDLQPGDALNNINKHVALFTGWTDASHTSANIIEESGRSAPTHVGQYSRSYLQANGFKPYRYNNVAGSSPTSYPDPASLPTGTLVKASNDPTVKLMISGAGLAVSGSDVTPDGYDMSKVVTVDDAKFWALPSSLPAGTVVHDQGGGANRYVIVGGAALPITGSEWTADGYSIRPDMGVPTSWLNAATAASLPAGTVVHDQGGGANRYVIVGGAALPITGSEWTADGYSIRPDMGVPGAWLASAQQAVLPTGTLVTGQSGGDPSIYVMINNSALPITGSEWTADGYAGQALMGAPEAWLATAVAKPLADRTVVKDVSGANATVYVMAGGKAVPLSGADYTALHYDTAPLASAPGTWLAAAAAKPAPADGTLLVSPDSATVWLVTGHGSKKALTAADFGPGKYDLAKVVTVPTALTASLPTVTS
ncbi:hypothetical protein [Kitasatospora indigofera]|uniref:hypothetical protein n=1 Tax=Kitasatospora indigofera TaxID=67307 RepID=UPI0033A1F9F1